MPASTDSIAVTDMIELVKSEEDVKPELVKSEEQADDIATTVVEDEHSSESPLSERLRRMKILMIAAATPLVLSGSEIIGSAWEKLGGDKMVQVDYFRFDINGESYPVPVLVPISFFGGDIANVQKWVTEQKEALSLMIKAKASLIVDENEFLPSYLRLEDMNIEAAKDLCRQQFVAAQAYVECKKKQTSESLEWLLTSISEAVRNQYLDWKELPAATTEKISEILVMLKEANPTPAFLTSGALSMNETLKFKANSVFSNFMEDSRIKRMLETGQDAKVQIEELTQQLRERTYVLIDFEMFSFTRDYLNNLFSSARDNFIEPHMRLEVVQTVMMQTSVFINFMKHRIDEMLDQTQNVSGYDLSHLRELIQNISLFDTAETAAPVNKDHDQEQQQPKKKDD